MVRNHGRLTYSRPVDVVPLRSIPIVSALAGALPDAGALLVGATDGYPNIHGPNERVLLDEFERAIVAEAEFFREYAARAAPAA